MVGLRQSPELEIVEDGDSIAEIQPPSSTTQSRELSRQSNHQKLLSQGTSENSLIAQSSANSSTLFTSE